MDHCAKCNLSFGLAEPKHRVGDLVWHIRCWQSLSNWLQARITQTGTAHHPN
jgi:hypothetical protein